MDPVSITVSTFAVLAEITKLSKWFSDVKKGVESIDHAVSNLFTELDSLQNMIECIDLLFRNPIYMQAVQDDHLQSPSSTISALEKCLNCVNNCVPTIESLGDLLEDVAPHHKSSLLRRTVRHFKLEDRQAEIARLRGHIQSHQAGMHMCISVVHMCRDMQSDERNQVAMRKLTLSVENLSSHIKSGRIHCSQLEATQQKTATVDLDETKIINDLEALCTTSESFRHRAIQEVQRRMSLVVDPATIEGRQARLKSSLRGTSSLDAMNADEDYQPIPLLARHVSRPPVETATDSGSYNAILRRDNTDSPRRRTLVAASTSSLRSKCMYSGTSQTESYVTVSKEDFEQAMSEAIHAAELKKKDADKPFSDEDFNDFSRLLRQVGEYRWSERPRTYIVLRLVGQLHVMDELITNGFKDVNFPYDEKHIPDCLRGAARHFLEKQTLVFSPRTADLVQGGAHRHIGKSADASFDIIRVLGKGGYGVIDQVRSKLTLQEYARKRIKRSKIFAKDKQALQAFENEIHNLKRLDHRHLVKFVGSYTDAKYVGIIMDPVAETDLRRYLMRDDFPAADLANLRCFFGCLASAVLYLHQQNCRHKDLKPANILILKGQVKITDFGTARDWSELNQDTTIGRPGAFTPTYAAPEVANERPRNTKADVWSLGLVFLDILTVLKSRSLEQKTLFFKREGTHLSAAWSNRHALETWIGILENQNMEHRKPLRWIREMTNDDPKHRPDATTLHQEILSTNHEEDHTYCGECCSEIDTSDGESWHGSETDQEDENTRRPGSITMSSTRSEQLSPRSAMSSSTSQRTPSHDVATPMRLRSPGNTGPAKRTPPPVPPRLATKSTWRSSTRTSDRDVPSVKGEPQISAAQAIYQTATIASAMQDASHNDLMTQRLADHDGTPANLSMIAKTDVIDIRSPSSNRAGSTSKLKTNRTRTTPKNRQIPAEYVAEDVNDTLAVGEPAELEQDLACALSGSAANKAAQHSPPREVLAEDHPAVKLHDNNDLDIVLDDESTCSSAKVRQRRKSLRVDSTVTMYEDSDYLQSTMQDHLPARSVPANLMPVHVRETRQPAKPDLQAKELPPDNLVDKLNRLMPKRFHLEDLDDLEAAIADARKSRTDWRMAVVRAISPSTIIAQTYTAMQFVITCNDDGLARDLLELYVQAGADVNACNYTSTDALQVATHMNRPLLAKYLLRYGADASHKNARKQTALHIACTVESTRVLPLLLRNQSISVINCKDDRGQTALHQACKRGSLDMVQMLVDAGARSTETDWAGLLPLDHCPEDAKEDIEAILATTCDALSSQFDEPSGDEPPPYDSLSRSSQSQTAACLCEACLFVAIEPALKRPNGDDALDCACSDCILTVARAMFSDWPRLEDELEDCDCVTCDGARSRCSGVRARSDTEEGSDHADSRTEDENTLSDIADLYRGHDYWDAEIDEGSSRPCDCEDCESSEQLTPIDLLTEAGFTGKKSYRLEPNKAWTWVIDNRGYTDRIIPVVRLLLDCGASINAAGNKGLSMLHAAVVNDNVALAKFLIQEGARLDVERTAFFADKAHYTPLDYAIVRRKPVMVRLLLREGADVNRRMSKLHFTPLHLCVYEDTSDGCDTELAAMLLAHGADVNHSERDGGLTPLQLAIKLDCFSCARLFIESGADLDLATRSAPQPLFYAIDLKRHKIAGLLVRHGVNPHATFTQQCALLRAAHVGHGDTIRAIVDDVDVAEDVNSRDDDGRTPLHILAEAPAREIGIAAGALIEAGADVTAEDDNGSTPLHYAAKSGSAYLVCALMAEGAIEKAQNRDGKTALDLAMAARHKEVVEFLGGKLKKKKWYRRS